jgi:alpha-tubulin suppressor-like RCC1 family protein
VDTNWQEVRAGLAFTLAYKTNGTLWSWGLNNIGQLGSGTTTSRSSPVQIGTLTNWSSNIGVGYSHSMAVKSDGTIWVWGSNTFGQIGDYSVVSRSSPVQLGTTTDWSKVSGGNASSHAIKTDGSLWSWGYNGTGDLGLGHLISGNSTLISIPIQVGGYDPVWKELPTGNMTFFGAIKTNNTLWTWGPNASGQIGDGTVVTRSSPVQIGGAEWSSFTSGAAAKFAIKTDGTLWAWGLNTTGPGNLGIAPVIPSLSNNKTWSSFSVGSSNIMAIGTNGTLWSWGKNDFGQIGDGTVINRSSPVQIGTLTNWASVSASGASPGTTMAIKTDGTLWGWGGNSNGQIGDGTVINRSSPVQIGTLTNWASVSANQLFTVAVKTDGTLWSWGYNAFGELGQNNTTNRSSPVQIGTLSNWSKISAGGGWTNSIKTDGTLWGWGQNGAGWIGDGTIVNRSSPVQIGTLTNWASVSSGNDHTMAIKTDGTLWGWGFNNVGQVGDGTVISRSSPVQIGTGNTWSSVSAGQSQTIAIKADGSMWGWGGASLNGTGISGISSPIQIGITYDWSNASSSTSNSAAIKTNGSIFAWGNDSAGQIGRGFVYSTSDNRSSPVQIGADPWKSVRASTYSVVAVRSDGTLWTWGTGTSGQIGDNTLVSKSFPVQIGTATRWNSAGSNVEAGFAIYETYVQ